MKNRIFLASLFLLVNMETLTCNDIGTKTTDQQNKTGVELLLEQYDWNYFWSEFTLDLSTIIACEFKNVNESIIGVAATSIEPLYLVDAGTSNSKMMTLGVEIGSYLPEQQGTSTVSGGVYVNIFKFPLMNMLLKNTTKGMFDWEKGYPQLVYAGQTDPKKWNDILAFSMIPERGIFATTFGAIAGAASCAANEPLDLLSGSTKRQSASAESLREVVDSLYYSAGCLGSVPTGTMSTSDSPIANAILTATSVMQDVHSHKGMTADLFAAHSVKSTLNGYSKKVLCERLPILSMPLTQYTVQLLSPTVSGAHEIGVSDMTYAFKNYKGEANKSVMIIFSKRNDYMSF